MMPAKPIPRQLDPSLIIWRKSLDVEAAKIPHGKSKKLKAVLAARDSQRSIVNDLRNRLMAATTAYRQAQQALDEACAVNLPAFLKPPAAPLK